MSWSTDISKAPHGYYEIQTRRLANGGEAIHEIFRPQYVWLASKCGKVTLSSWIPPEVSPGGKPMKGGRRWEFFSRNEMPIAWHPFDPSDTIEVFIERKVKGETQKVPVTQYRKPDYPSELLEAA